MLFALPALRNIQPGVPPIGSSEDLAGFMWNMLLIAAAIITCLINYIRKFRFDGAAAPATLKGFWNKAELLDTFCIKIADPPAVAPAPAVAVKVAEAPVPGGAASVAAADARVHDAK
jgi:hypothetical protein